MISLTHEDRLREASVVLADGERDEWLQVIKRSGRLKTSRTSLLDRVPIAFGEHDPAASEALVRALLKSGPTPPERLHQLLAVLAGAQLIEFFQARSGSQTSPSTIDAAALAVRILARTSKRPIFPDLVAHASAWLERRGDVVRMIEPIGSPETEPTTVDLDLEGVTVEVAEFETLRIAHNQLGQETSALGAWVSNNRSQ